MSDEIDDYIEPEIEDEDKPEPNPRETLEEMFPGVDVPHLTAVVELLYRTGMEVKDIEYIEPTPYVEVGLKGEEWLVLNDDEADEKAREEIDDVLENDLNSLLAGWKDFVNNGEDFNNLLAEKVMEYIDAIREEPANNEGMTELDQQMAEAGATTEEEFEVIMANKWAPSGDAIDWYIKEYGDEAFKEIADIDTEAYTNHILITEGRGAIIAEDGEEMSLGKNYYAYRIN